MSALAGAGAAVLRGGAPLAGGGKGGGKGGKGKDGKGGKGKDGKSGKGGKGGKGGEGGEVVAAGGGGGGGGGGASRHVANLLWAVAKLACSPKLVHPGEGREAVVCSVPRPAVARDPQVHAAPNPQPPICSRALCTLLFAPPPPHDHPPPGPHLAPHRTMPSF